jgi:hypothetical protein
VEILILILLDILVVLWVDICIICGDFRKDLDDSVVIASGMSSTRELKKTLKSINSSSVKDATVQE